MSVSVHRSQRSGLSAPEVESLTALQKNLLSLMANISL